jgi:hypothetical protein
MHKFRNRSRHDWNGLPDGKSRRVLQACSRQRQRRRGLLLCGFFNAHSRTNGLHRWWTHLVTYDVGVRQDLVEIGS